MPQTFLKFEDPKLDGRVKLTPEAKQQIRGLYFQGNSSHKSLSLQFGVSRRLIGLIVSDKSAETMKAYQKGRWKLYYDKEKQKESQKKYRDKKRKLGLVREKEA